MNNYSIRVSNLSKQYRLGSRERNRSLRDTLTDTMTAPFRVIQNWRRSDGKTPPADDWIWALNDVSLEITRGEVIGIIGRNGAGKSTLLKILSRITEPTKGFAEIHGRVGSLLEVGTGFHPELTGRENIFLNGAILGMKKAEIVRKFDDIVAFAEIDKFLDTPVKHYSSGMYVRLAFAVAAHLEPEILLVDEVLAVGDTVFQKKCIGKIGDVAKEGRTVLFVSHNMGAIAQLCPKSVLLRAGSIEAIGPSENIIQQYISSGVSTVPDIRIEPNFNPSAPMIFTHCWIGDEEGKSIPSVDVTRGFSIGLEVLVRRQIWGADIAIRIYNGLAQPIFTLALSNTPGFEDWLSVGKHKFLLQIPGMFLAPDTYSLTAVLHRLGTERYDLREYVLTFQVEESGSGMWQHGQGYGNILIDVPWRHTLDNSWIA